VVIIANKWKQLLVRRQFMLALLMLDQRQLKLPFLTMAVRVGQNWVVRTENSILAKKSLFFDEVAEKDK
jgi:hypothetical protein